MSNSITGSAGIAAAKPRASKASSTAKSARLKPCRLRWRTRIVMAERGVRSVSALRRLLAGLGIDISEAQLGRIVDGRSSHFNARVLAGLLTALDCGLTDLLAVH